MQTSRSKVTYKWPQKDARDWSQSDKLRPSSFSFSRPPCAKRSITTYSKTSYSSCNKPMEVYSQYFLPKIFKSKWEQFRKIIWSHYSEEYKAVEKWNMQNWEGQATSNCRKADALLKIKHQVTLFSTRSA